MSKKIGMFISSQLNPNTEVWLSKYGKVTYLGPEDKRDDLDLLVISGGSSTSLTSPYVQKKNTTPIEYKMPLDTNMERLHIKGSLFHYFHTVKTPILLLQEAVELLPILNDSFTLVTRETQERVSCDALEVRNGETHRHSLPNIRMSRFYLDGKESPDSLLPHIIGVFSARGNNTFIVSPRIISHMYFKKEKIGVILFDPQSIHHLNSSRTYMKYGIQYGDLLSNQLLFDMLNNQENIDSYSTILGNNTNKGRDDDDNEDDGDIEITPKVPILTPSATI